MQDATSLEVALQPLLPLRIGAVEYNDPTLNVIGERWSLVLLGGWTWRRDDEVVAGAARPAAEDAVWNLCGSEVIGVNFPDPLSTGIVRSLSRAGPSTSAPTAADGRRGPSITMISTSSLSGSESTDHRQNR